MFQFAGDPNPKERAMQHDPDRCERDRRKLEEELQRTRYDLQMCRMDLARSEADRADIRLVDGETGRPLAVQPPHRPTADRLTEGQPMPPQSRISQTIAKVVYEKHQAQRERDAAQAEAKRLATENDALRQKLSTAEEHIRDLLRMGDDHS